MKKACLLILLSTSSALAQSPIELLERPADLYARSVSERDRALGIAKLKAAAKLNGDKMCCGFVGTEDVPCYEIKGASGQSFFECAQPEPVPDAKKVTTERVMPVVDPKAKNPLDAISDLTNPDPPKKHKKHGK